MPPKNGAVPLFVFTAMVSALSQAEVLIALVVAAHAGVLAVRLCFSLYKA
jgi:photosystem I subunit 12